MFENPTEERQASKKFYNKCSENSRSQIVFQTDIFRKLPLSAPARCGITMQISSSMKPARSYTLLGYYRAGVAQDNILKVYLSTVRPVIEYDDRRLFQTIYPM